MPKPLEVAHEAVLFLASQQVSHQLRYSEFEALLDGVVTMPDHADQELKAVYVQLDRQLHVRALVFFLLYFDEEGRADPEWNLPLQRLAKISGTGPDLGAGPVKLAMRSQCPISWHQKDLWDPLMQPGANDFQAIRKALRENRLGLPIPVEPEVTVHRNAGGDREEERIPTLDVTAESTANPVGASASEPSRRDRRQRLKTARILRSLRLRIKMLISQHDSEISELIREHRLEVQAFRAQSRESEQTIEQLKVLNDQLKDKLSKRNEQYLLLQSEVSHYKKRFTVLEKELAGAMPEQEAARMRQRMEGELSILHEQLERREAELFYRDEREEQFRQEVASLKEQLEASQRGELVHRLAALDVVFVVYHPGAGHITLPADDVRRYAENPLAYAAERCFVSEEHYRHWLEHYESPVCTRAGRDGTLCGAVVTRVAQPSDFRPGIDDRCAAHQGAAAG